MVGRRSPQNPSISQLTLPPETILSCYPEKAPNPIPTTFRTAPRLGRISLRRTPPQEKSPATSQPPALLVIPGVLHNFAGGGRHQRQPRKVDPDCARSGRLGFCHV